MSHRSGRGSKGRVVGPRLEAESAKDLSPAKDCAKQEEKSTENQDKYEPIEPKWGSKLHPVTPLVEDASSNWTASASSNPVVERHNGSYTMNRTSKMLMAHGDTR